jgi:hypothetical protein
MQHSKILIQLDSDPLVSSFDAVVALDAGVDHLLQYASIEPSNVTSLVHGAMFTRGPEALKNTAIFIGGSRVNLGDSIATAVRENFFGPMSVSVMLDGNGSNTTSAAAVLSAGRHVDFTNCRAVVFGGTGPVGSRVARLLLRQGARVGLVSRDESRAKVACEQILTHVGADASSRLEAVGGSQKTVFEECLQSADAVFGCGAAGVELLTHSQMAMTESCRVAVDLNAVPPAGLAGIEVTDKAVRRGNRVDYGAIGVGGLKMKIHRAAIQQLFTRNNLVLDAEEIFEVGQSLENPGAEERLDGQ